MSDDYGKIACTIQGDGSLAQIYPPESAGRVMTAAVPTASLHATIADIERLLLKRAKDFASITYVFIVDGNNNLKGILSIKEVFQGDKKTLVADRMAKDLITVTPEVDRERVVHMALAHQIKSIPVVDETGKFLGVVLNDTILHTLYLESSEDLLRMAGIKQAEALCDNVMKISVYRSLKHRLPWLLLGLVGGLLAAGIIGRFEHTLQQNLILATFIPLVVYMSDAVGTQMEAFIIRDLAINPSLNFIAYLGRQLLIIGLIGGICSVLICGLSLLLYEAPWISVVLSLSLFIAIASSVITGLVIPYIFGRLQLDPANASGPIATIIQDILSITIFFGFASVLL